MKTFKSSGKQNDDNLIQTKVFFFPNLQTKHQSHLISEMQTQILLRSATPGLTERSGSSQRIRNLKKNSNKIEGNIRIDRRLLTRSTTKKNIGTTKIISLALRNSDHDNKQDKLRKTKCYIKAEQKVKSKATSVSDVAQIYPRYKMLELYVLYQSILQYAKEDTNKLLHGFQSALTYHKIMIKPQIVKKSLFQQKKLEFEDFLRIFKKMQDLMFIQSIIDYLEIIFQSLSSQKMSYLQVCDVLKKRSNESDSTIITDKIYRKLKLQKQSSIQLQQILDLCEQDMQFCSCFSQIYHKQEQEK